MKGIKRVACILAYTFLVVVLAAAWFVSFALGYFTQDTWVCIPCVEANLILGAALAGLTGEKGERMEEKEMMQNDYAYNRRFREYVDKYCRKHGCTVAEALTHELVRQAWRHYMEV